MTTINIDREKVDRMVQETLMRYHDSGAHPAEVVLALAECIARVILAVGEMGASDIAKKELVDLAIKHMAFSIDHHMPRIQ